MIDRGMGASAAPRTSSVEQLTKGSAALGAVVAINALSGLIFWVIAARLRNEDAIGDASALLQWSMLINLLAGLGLPMALGRLAIGTDLRARRIYHWAIVVSMGGSMVFAAIFSILATDEVLEPVRSFGRGGTFILFTLLAVGTSLAVLSDMRLMTLRRWRFVVMRAVAVLVLRFVLVPFSPTDDVATWLFLVAVGAPAVTGFFAAAALVRGQAAEAFGRPDGFGGFLKFSVTNWFVHVCTQGLVFGLPAIVSLHVADDDFASFYVAWSIAAMVILLPQVISQVLLTEGSRDDIDESRSAAFTLQVSLAITALATAVATFSRDLLSVFYGAEYSSAEHLLPFLTAAAIPWSISATAMTVLRINRDDRMLAMLGVILAAVTAPLAYVMSDSSGIDGGTRAWLYGHLVTAVVAGWAMRTTLRRAFDPNTTESPSVAAVAGAATSE